MNNYALQWHPKFSQYPIVNEGVLFVSEYEEFLLESHEFELLNTWLQSSAILSDFVFKASVFKTSACKENPLQERLSQDNGDDENIFQSNNLVAQVKRLERIDQLLADEILLRREEVFAIEYFQPNFDQDFEISEYGNNHVYWLSSIFKPNSVILRWVNNLATEIPVSLVMIDDYFDPRLDALSIELRDQKKAWLLIKLSGEMAMIGPLFRQEIANAPCFQCLKSRLEQNKPVREWFRRHYSKMEYAVPMAYNEDRVIDILPRLTGYFQQVIDLEVLSQIIQFHPEDHRETIHHLEKRPQCRSCGDPLMFQKQAQLPIQLEDCQKHDNSDGGYRIYSREYTNQRINSLISPITGIITNLTELTKSKLPRQLHIYRAAYFQNTFQKLNLTLDTFVQLSLGKGISKQQAQSSALGEALERQAAQYRGDELIEFSVPERLKHHAYLPQQLTPYSQNQYQSFASQHGVSLRNPQWIKAYDKCIAIHWIPGWSLSSGQPVYFPAAYCLANTPFQDQVYSLYNHNGNAAGNSMEEAILQGTLELIERDATAIWWYNQVPRPEIDINIIPKNKLEIIRGTLDKDWNYWILDISHDIEVVSCVAVGQHKQSEKFVLGFGTHLDPSIACQRAITEMFQLIIIKDEVTGPFDFNAIGAHPFLFPKRTSAKKNLGDFYELEHNNMKLNIEYLIDILSKRQLELCVVDYSRADICLKTIKVIVPGLCHMWPQLANPRLYKVPVKLNWLSAPLSENELNPMALYL